MYRLAVVGNPIVHSLSPTIFSEFSKQTSVELQYNKICAPIEGFENTVKEFFNQGGHALNITAPFKARAFSLADELYSHTLLPQTANVLLKKDNFIIADNTDGLGLVADLTRSGISLKGKNILIIGSGSVIFSVLPSIEESAPAKIDLLMRNYTKLEEFTAKSALVSEYSDNVEYDIVINTTPNTHENQLFQQVKLLNTNACAYDMTYVQAETIFMKAMRKLNPSIQVLNGLGMLIQQAKFGFHTMFGIYPEVDNLYPLLNGILNGN